MVLSAPAEKNDCLSGLNTIEKTSEKWPCIVRNNIGSYIYYNSQILIKLSVPADINISYSLPQTNIINKQKPKINLSIFYYEIYFINAINIILKIYKV